MSRLPPFPDKDLSDLSERVTSCRACGLCCGRRVAVPGAGSCVADLMLVGDGVGGEEEEARTPFVGAAAKYLEGALFDFRLKPYEIYMTHAVKCLRIPARNPSVQEVEACRPHLTEEITIVRPNALLALGWHAARALIHGPQWPGDKCQFGDFRGRWFFCLDRPVRVTYHPLFVQRHPENLSAFKTDIEAAVVRARAIDPAGAA